MSDQERFAELVERAFIQFVTDGHRLERGSYDQPPVLGCCRVCGFPVYESGGLHHYSYEQSPTVRACDTPTLSAPEARNGGRADDEASALSSSP